jgi:hypothetical protein
MAKVIVMEERKRLGIDSPNVDVQIRDEDM